MTPFNFAILFGVIFLLVLLLLTLIYGAYRNAQFQKKLNATIIAINSILLNNPELSKTHKESHYIKVADGNGIHIQIDKSSNQLVINGSFLYSTFLFPSPKYVSVSDMPIEEFLNLYPCSVYLVYGVDEHYEEYEQPFEDVNFASAFFPILQQLLIDLNNLQKIN